MDPDDVSIGRTPFARLSDCSTELIEKGYSIQVNRDVEELFYIRPEKSKERTGESIDVLQGFAHQLAVENHNLHFFEANEKWVVSTLPEEDSGEFLF